MDGRVVTDFESSVTMDKEETTDFVEAAAVVNGATSNSTFEVSTYVENSVGIKEFLGRPIKIGGGQWTTATAPGGNLFTSSIAALLTGNPMWADKIRGFNLIRGDFMIKIVINASPFQQGRLLLHYLPNYNNFVAVNPNYGKFKNKTLVQKLQHPHVEIDARTTSVVMRIPYIAPTAWYAITENYYDWGTVWLDVFSALVTGPSAPVSQAYVDYAVYGWFENVELNANTVPQSSGRVIRGGSEEVKENSGPIEIGLRKVSKVANAISGIPLVSSYAKGVAWASNISADVASVFGWSKPREEEGQTNVYKQTLRYAGTCDGPNSALPGGISVLNRLETIDYGSYTNEDEMSTKFLYSVPYFAGAFTWNVGDAPGHNYYSHKLSPTSILTTVTDTVGAHSLTYEEHVPFTYLAKFFAFWRGSLKLTMKFVKTQMHSGRLQVTWTPINNPGTTPDLTTSSYSKRAIIDIRTEDTVTFELPYLIFSDYLPTAANSYEATTSGQIDVMLLNDLRAPESCAQSIEVLVFISAGDDFELAVPCPCEDSSVPYIPQSSEVVIARPQSSEAVLVRDSIKQGTTMVSKEIGGVNTRKDDLFHAKRCIGEKLMSVKSLLLRNQSIQGFTGSSLNIHTVTDLVFDPWYMSATDLGATGLQRAPDFVGDAFSLIGLMYAYSRGSINMTGYDTSSTNRMFTVVAPNQSTPFTTQPHTNAVMHNTWFANNVSLNAGNNYIVFEPCNIIDEPGFAYQHVPYYNKFPFALNTYYNSVDDVSVNYSKPVTTLQFSQAGNFSTNTAFLRSVGDDFQFMFFTGAPCLVRSYA